MTVKEVIEKLREYPADAPIHIWDSMNNGECVMDSIYLREETGSVIIEGDF